MERFAILAKPRIDSLLKLQSGQHLYDPAPGRLFDTSALNGMVTNRFKQALQPYRDLGAFTSDERIMPHVIDAGLIPIVKALLQELRGNPWLITRNFATLGLGAVANIEGVGVRIRIYTDHDAGDTIVAWEALYGAGTPRKV